MRNPVPAVLTILPLVLWVSPLFAHHSFSAEYNITSPVALKGEITAVEWNNPHVFLHIAVRDDAGIIHDWHVEGGAINAVNQNGWTFAMLQQLVKSHDPVIVTGYRGRNKPASAKSDWIEAWGKDIELPDGRRMPFN